MLCTRAILGAIGGAIVVGGASAGFNAASGAIGSAILATGYPDYSANESAQMGAIGGAIIGGSVGALAGMILALSGSVSANSRTTLLAFVAGAVLESMAGYGVMNNYTATKTIMNLGETALSTLIGASILGVGLGVGHAKATNASDKTPVEIEVPADLEQQATLPRP